MQNTLHNHEPSVDMSGHPSCHKLSSEQILVIERITRAAVQTRQILSALRQENINTKAVSRTIANMKCKLQKERLAGRTPIQALFDEVGQESEKCDDYIWDLERFKNILDPECQSSVIGSDRELALMNAIKQDWEMFLSDWNSVIYSRTEEEYVQNWTQFELLYKEKEDATRAEGAHAKLKEFQE
ncbi:hypothetical protein AgCh_013752 [Apium graveolens]